MPNFKALDEQRRLTPWSMQQHADFVAGQYGALLAQDPGKAATYLSDYKAAEDAFNEAYRAQQESLNASCQTLNAPPQKLPTLEKIDWDPSKRFAMLAKPAEAAPAEPKAEKKLAKTKKPTHSA